MSGFDQGHPPIRWGIMSTARIAKKVWKALRECGVAEVVAVASRDVERADTFITTCMAQAPFAHRPEALGSYAELLARDDIQAVYIPLPTGVRKEWVLKAAAARKNILVEKPVGESAADVKEMVTAAINANVHLMDGVMFMHSARLTALRASLAEIGAIRSIHTAFAFRGDKSFFEHDIRAQGTTEPLGALGDLGWYSIRFSLWVREWQMPVKVRGTIQAQSEAGVPYEVSGELLYADGTSATFFSSFLASCVQSATIAGQEATIELGDFVLPVAGRSSEYRIVRQTIQDDGLDMVVERHETKMSVPEASHGHRTSQEANMIRHFSDLVRRGPVTTSWSAQIISTQVVLDAVLLSARGGGRWVDVTDE